MAQQLWDTKAGVWQGADGGRRRWACASSPAVLLRMKAVRRRGAGSTPVVARCPRCKAARSSAHVGAYVDGMQAPSKAVSEVVLEGGGPGADRRPADVQEHDESRLLLLPPVPPDWCPQLTRCSQHHGQLAGARAPHDEAPSAGRDGPFFGGLHDADAAEAPRAGNPKLGG